MAARISTNPILVKELQAAKMMNLQTDKLDRMEKLMGENGNFQAIVEISGNKFLGLLILALKHWVPLTFGFFVF